MVKCLTRQNALKLKCEATFLRVSGTETEVPFSPLVSTPLFSGREADKCKPKLQLSKNCTFFIDGMNPTIRWQTSQCHNKSQNVKIQSSPTAWSANRPWGNNSVHVGKQSSVLNVLSQTSDLTADLGE